MTKFNYYGSYSLFLRETKRFLKVYHQSIIAPIVNALIFLSIFTLAVGNSREQIHNVPYKDFAGYGLIIMVIIQNSFANTSSSLIMSKLLGYINDILMPPLDGEEIVLAYTLSATLRGLIIGGILTIILFFLIEFRIHNFFLLVYFVLMACSLLANLGTLSSQITENFDQNSTISSYIIVPLSFLSGTFYSIHDLPNWMKYVNLGNPFFYIIDGFRYSLIGESDGNIMFGMIYIFFLNFIVTLLVIKIFNSGWRIKS